MSLATSKIAEMSAGYVDHEDFEKLTEAANSGLNAHWLYGSKDGVIIHFLPMHDPINELKELGLSKMAISNANKVIGEQIEYWHLNVNSDEYPEALEYSAW